MTCVPFDFEASVKLPGWRDTLAWPVSPRILADSLSGLLRRYLDGVSLIMDRNDRDIALLAGSTLSNVAAEALELALCVHHAQQRNIDLVGASQLLRHFCTGEPLPQPDWAPNFHRSKVPFATTLRVTSRWSRVLNLASVVLAPNASVMSINPLLVDYAKRSPQRFIYRDPGSVLAAARARRDKAPDSARLKDLARILARKIASCPHLDETTVQRLFEYLEPWALVTLSNAERDLDCLARYPSLPNMMLSGTGGKYVVRALGLAIMRRGGDVTRFAHSVTLGLIPGPELTAVAETSVGTKFVVATPQLAQNVRDAVAKSSLPSWGLSVVEGQVGDPMIRSLPLHRRPRSQHRRTVIYAPTMIRHSGRHVFSTIAPLVYLDWQLKLAQELQKLPIHLVCKPHPEGVFENRKHPLEGIAQTSYEPFEQLIEDADVFVFDRATSTTFGEALCTDRPIVYIDLGPPGFHDNVWPMIRERCAVIEATYSSLNTPDIDWDQLAHSIIDLPRNADPSAFETLILDNPSGNERTLAA